MRCDSIVTAIAPGVARICPSSNFLAMSSAARILAPAPLAGFRAAAACRVLWRGFRPISPSAPNGGTTAIKLYQDLALKKAARALGAQSWPLHRGRTRLRLRRPAGSGHRRRVRGSAAESGGARRYKKSTAGRSCYSHNHWQRQRRAVGSLIEVNLMTTAYINFHGPINPSTVQHLMAACGNAITQGHDELYSLVDK